jgi:hypothetical protein
MQGRRFLPDELLAHFRSIRATATDAEFFNRPKFKKAQEIWCAAHFARGYSQNFPQTAVHISDVDEQTDVDFELEAMGSLHPFQVTEVQVEGRRRGSEYKGREPGQWEDEDWSRGSKDGATWIRDAIDKKARRYGAPASLNLLVYLNFPAWDQRYDEIQVVAHQPAQSFKSVWLLNGNALCCIRPSPDLPSWVGWLPMAESPVKE